MGTCLEGKGTEFYGDYKHITCTAHSFVCSAFLMSVQIQKDRESCLFNIKGRGTHEYWTQDASSKAYEEPFDPGAVAERCGIKDLVRTMGGCHKTNLMTNRKSPRLPADDLNMLPTQHSATVFILKHEHTLMRVKRYSTKHCSVHWTQAKISINR